MDSGKILSPDLENAGSAVFENGNVKQFDFVKGITGESIK